MSVHTVCATMLDEMHVNTAVQILPFCLMHNLLQGVSSGLTFITTTPRQTP